MELFESDTYYYETCRFRNSETHIISEGATQPQRVLAKRRPNVESMLLPQCFFPASSLLSRDVAFGLSGFRESSSLAC